MATPHIESKKEDIAATVLMPGDPLRAKYIAEHYLEEAKCVNTVRNMYGYTGIYKNHKITVFASGMGNPSIGIYSYELFHDYDVENIIRIGTAGSYVKELNVMDVLLVEDCYSSSSYAKEQNGNEDSIISSSKTLTNSIEQTAALLHKPLKKGRVHCGDALYKQQDNYEEIANQYHCLAGEMESFALFHNARVLEKKAACILTISNSLITWEETDSEKREKGLNDMIILALESAIKNEL